MTGRTVQPVCRIIVDLDTGVGWVSGADAKGLIVAAGGQATWSQWRLAWGCSAEAAVDACALADARGYAVSFERVGRDPE